MAKLEITDFLKKVHIGDYITLDCEFRRLFGGTRAERRAGYIEIITSQSVHLSKTNPLKKPKDRTFLPGGILYWAIKSYEIKR